SNNTIFADAEGNIAYFHSNYIPRRDARFDWSQPVDGSDPATDYDGVLTYEETPNAVNPDVGWVYNANNWPWSAAGPDSPDPEDYPAYVETMTAETPRGKHALMLLEDPDPFTMGSLTELAYDSYLPSFAEMVPALVHAYDEGRGTRTVPDDVTAAIGILRDWDYRWGVSSIPTSIAVFWGEEVLRRVAADARG